jgi:hypothetical protein
MSVLDNFVEEMLQQAVPKQALIERWIHGLDNEKPPQFSVPVKKYTFESNLHGFIYDYQRNTVTISYKVANSIYQDMTVSFATFRALLEGLAVCIRQQKW